MLVLEKKKGLKSIIQVSALRNRKARYGGVRWCTSIFLALGRLMKKDSEFEVFLGYIASLEYTARHHLKKQNKPLKTKTKSKLRKEEKSNNS
jgi:hypothetical protein